MVQKRFSPYLFFVCERNWKPCSIDNTLQREYNENADLCQKIERGNRKL